MIHLPQPPDTFTTLQIPCVACNEVFTIAEAYQTATGQWRLPTDHHPSVQMRYEDNLTRQPIRSVTRADPEINPDSFDQRQPDTYINCPRCGADNRNWLQINGPAPIPVGCALRFFFPRSTIAWQQKFPGAFLSIIVAIILAPVTLLMAMAVQESWGWGLTLAIAVILAAIFTAVDLTDDWVSLRLDLHIRAIKPTKRSQEARLWQRGILIIALLAFIIPIVFFQMAPRALGVVSRLLRDTPKTAVITGNQQLNQLNQNYDQITIEAIETAIADIEKIEKDQEISSEDVKTQISERLDQVQEDLEAQNQLILTLAQKDIDAQIKHLEDVIVEAEKLIDETRTNADAAAINDITADLRIIGLWVIMVGLSSLASVLMSMRALKSYVAGIDSMLPRPIFSSVADMTRVTIWEAKRSLQISNDMGHIQWTEAHRNGTGGIDLIGLHRAAPDLDAQGNPLSQTVRAQRYVIHTNLWGHILNTLVRDVRVPYTIVPDRKESASESDNIRNPPPTYITIPPEPPAGDDLAQRFFTAPPPPPSTPSKRLVIKEATAQLESTPHQQTAVSPTPLPYIPAPLERETPAAKKERLCQIFALILNQKFTDTQLQKSYAGLGLRYGHIPGTRLELCQDLIRFYQRRQRLSELVNNAIKMFPHLAWNEIFDLLDD